MGEAVLVIGGDWGAGVIGGDQVREADRREAGGNPKPRYRLPRLTLTAGSSPGLPAGETWTFFMYGSAR